MELEELSKMSPEAVLKEMNMLISNKAKLEEQYKKVFKELKISKNNLELLLD
jgi:hypothetical protein